MEAIRKDRKEIVWTLLNENADPNANSDRGFTPLMYASLRDSGEIIQILIQASVEQ